MKGQPRISSIYRMGEATARPTPDQKREVVAQKAWHEFGTVVLHPSDIADDWLRQAIINEANRRWGCRRSGR